MSDKASQQYYPGSPTQPSINAPSTWGTIYSAYTPASSVHSHCQSPSPAQPTYSALPVGSHVPSTPIPIPQLNPLLDYTSSHCLKFDLHAYGSPGGIRSYSSLEGAAFSQPISNVSIQFNASPAWRLPMDTVRFRYCPSVRAVLDHVFGFLQQQNAQDARAGHFVAPTLVDRNLNIPSSSSQSRLELLGRRHYFRGMTLAVNENGACVTVYVCSSDELRC